MRVRLRLRAAHVAWRWRLEEQPGAHRVKETLLCLALSHLIGEQLL